MKSVLRTRLTGVLLAMAAIVSSHSTVLAQDKAAKIDQLISLYHKYGEFNGAALVADNGQVILKRGYGPANMEWGIPNAPDTKFRLGSITKQFTATLILQLAEQGKIKLDGKVIECTRLSTAANEKDRGGDRGVQAQCRNVSAVF